jgi:hypothetical protein
MSAEEDHDMLIEIRGDVKYLRESQEKLAKTVYGEDGTGGLCGEVSKLKAFQSTLLAFVSALSIAISIAGNWVLNHLPGVR